MTNDFDVRKLTGEDLISDIDESMPTPWGKKFHEKVRKSNESGELPQCFGFIDLPMYDDYHYYCIHFVKCVVEARRLGELGINP